MPPLYQYRTFFHFSIVKISEHIYNVDMTLRLRNILMVLISLLSVFSLAFIIYIILSGAVEPGPGNISLFLPVILNSALSATGCIIIFTAFRNTASAEILFLLHILSFYHLIFEDL